MISFRLLRGSLGLLLLMRAASAQSTTADTAFQQSFQIDVPDSSGFSFVSYAVPHGKRLVVRYLAASGTVVSGQRFTTSVQTTLLGATADFPQVYTAQNSSGDGSDDLVSNQAVTIQADGDTTVYLQVFRRVVKGAIRVTFVMSGDLIPMPPQAVL